MASIRETFPAVFNGGGATKPHSAEFRQFGEDWGFQKVIYSMADDKITQVAQVKQEYLTDALTFLTYLIKKGEMEEKEDTWQENRRKAMRKR